MLALVLATGCNTLSDRLDAPLSQGERQIPTDQGVDRGEWPAWRGGPAHGVSPAESLPLSWSPRRNIAWKIPLDGAGNSSPVVWDDQVFLTSVVGQGNRAQLTLLSIDRHSGELRWQHPLGRPLGESHPKNGHASSTAATDGERVYAYFGANGLFCFTADGRRLWHRPLTDQSHEWGTASSPVLAGPLVIQLCDSQQASYLVAFDKISGNEVWRTPRDSNGCWTTPVLVQTAGDAPWQLVVNGTGSRDGASGYVRAYDPWTGQPLWRVAGTSDIACPTAIVGGGLIVCTSGPSARVLALDIARIGEKSTAVGDAGLRWKAAMGGPYVPTGVIYRERLYLVDDDGVASCLDVADGRRIWRHRLMSPVSASLIAGAGRIYVAGESGDVYVLAASDQFQLLAANSLHEPTLATPAAAHGDLFIRTASHLFCISDDAKRDTDPLPNVDDAALDAEAEYSAPSPSDIPVDRADPPSSR